MSLARAVTKRMKRSEVSKQPASPPSRSQSTRNPSQQIDRTKISLPVALVSTTNMLSYNAPDIATMKHASLSTSFSNSWADDSDHSVSTRSRASSHASRDTTLTDDSSVESSSPVSAKPNHLSGYFASGKQLTKSLSIASLQQVKEEIIESAPAIPERALSHSKRAHERLARKRSLQIVPGHDSVSSRNSGSVRAPREQRSSIDMFRATIQEESHPFGKELEQLNEVVEEFGAVARDIETEADLTVMVSKNLAAFCAADYLSEIQPLFTSRFSVLHQALPMAWI